jgi:hypothetical protein
LLLTLFILWQCQPTDEGTTTDEPAIEAKR